MQQPMRPPSPSPRQKTPKELLRETCNTAAVAVVASGFEAIDQLVEMGKDHFKKAIIRGIGGKQ